MESKMKVLGSGISEISMKPEENQNNNSSGIKKLKE
jgi:hypothetical protein